MFCSIFIKDRVIAGTTTCSPDNIPHSLHSSSSNATNANELVEPLGNWITIAFEPGGLQSNTLHALTNSAINARLVTPREKVLHVLHVLEGGEGTGGAGDDASQQGEAAPEVASVQGGPVVLDELPSHAASLEVCTNTTEDVDDILWANGLCVECQVEGSGDDNWIWTGTQSTQGSKLLIR